MANGIYEVSANADKELYRRNAFMRTLGLLGSWFCELVQCNRLSDSGTLSTQECASSPSTEAGDRAIDTDGPDMNPTWAPPRLPARQEKRAATHQIGADVDTTPSFAAASELPPSEPRLAATRSARTSAPSIAREITAALRLASPPREPQGAIYVRAYVPAASIIRHLDPRTGESASAKVAGP
ncbi:hypothetical protein WOLCODRAFT_163218 [Wolfiporia cocos MD-104 SS10]|uniref:Uncharacterized protein n=1 Tax=Wolfiporia cocos (strain MD-104) TaxID=742152 RepID=A0A2H3JS11_WOLCO|nr:hypothetical protein WOLCODRAFT_163218 [Wolfiporia cocos MD-104 SS10]